MSDDISDLCVPASVLAAAFGVTTRRVAQLANDGIIPRRGGKYPLLKSFAGYIKFLKTEQRKSTLTVSAAAVQDARAEQIRQRTAKEANELCDVEEALAAVDDIFGMLKAALDGLAARCTRDRDVRQVISREVNDILRRCAARFRQRASDLRAGRTIDGAEGALDAPGVEK